MNEAREQNKRYTTVAWGATFLLSGVLMALPGDQNGFFFLGTGAIFMGLNLLRRIKNIPVNLFSTLVGILAFGVGAYAVARPIWNLPPFQVGFIPLALIVVGLYILIPAPKVIPD